MARTLPKRVFYVWFVFVVFVFFVCKCVPNYCHRVATQLQLIKYIISYHIISYERRKVLEDDDRIQHCYCLEISFINKF
jgi:hypothetical protein